MTNVEVVIQEWIETAQELGCTTNVLSFTLDSPDERVLFVLTQLPCGKQIILLSSDLSLTGAEAMPLP